jgi:hypothetical protein
MARQSAPPWLHHQGYIKQKKCKLSHACKFYDGSFEHSFHNFMFCGLQNTLALHTALCNLFTHYFVWAIFKCLRTKF